MAQGVTRCMSMNETWQCAADVADQLEPPLHTKSDDDWSANIMLKNHRALWVEVCE